MKKFLNKILTLLLFILSLGCLYISKMCTFASHFTNIVFFVVGIFILLQACGKIDEMNGYGKYDKDNSNDKE